MKPCPLATEDECVLWNSGLPQLAMLAVSLHMATCVQFVLNGVLAHSLWLGLTTTNFLWLCITSVFCKQGFLFFLSLIVMELHQYQPST